MVDPVAVSKALGYFSQHGTKAPHICPLCKDLFLPLLGSTIPSKEVAFTVQGFAGRNV